MHAKYAKDGFVAMSVSLDDPKDAELMKNVRAFLQEQKATFPNFVLDEPAEVWMDKLKIVGPPTIFVFGRDGKLVRKFDGTEGNEVDYPKKIEPLVKELLQKKD
jgi:hypothetical protein